MQTDRSHLCGNIDAGRSSKSLRRRNPRCALLAQIFGALLLCLQQASSQQSQAQTPAPALPEAPQSQLPAHSKAASPCQLRRAGSIALQAAAIDAVAANPDKPPIDEKLKPVACPPLEVVIEPLKPIVNWYDRFIDGPQVKPMTPGEKAWLAFRNVSDPFTALTITADAAIAVGANAHSPYGPGMTGFGRYVGVSYSQDMTGEFFGTFLIPSIAHQDPHYHRMPKASMTRRIAHAIYQVVWTQGDNGKHMLNYADLVGFAIDDEIGNLYVPGQKTNLRASAERYATGLAIAPVDNFITEFLPDIARRIHVRDVLIQRIINQVAKADNTQ